MGVSKNNGAPKSSILIGFSLINHPFWGFPLIFGNTHMMSLKLNMILKFGIPESPGNDFQVEELNHGETS